MTEQKDTIEKKPKGRRSAKKGQHIKKKKGGRPTKYTKELAMEILCSIAEGESLLKICKSEHMPTRKTVHEWLLQDKYRDFSDNYARAREMQAEYLFDETLEISDGVTDKFEGDKGDFAEIEAAKLRVDTRKFYISKVLPKKYGDKIDVTSGGEPLKANKITFVKFKGDADKPKSTSQ